jgi:hypothetical protein
MSVIANKLGRIELLASPDTMPAREPGFTAGFRNESTWLQLPTGRPQVFVNILCIDFAVGSSQRREIEQRRGFRRGAFGYNEGPTSSCHTFCWKARHSFDVPFF